MEHRLYWNNYKYYPYEKEFALKEVQVLINPERIIEDELEDYITIITKESLNQITIDKLTYFKKVETNNATIIPKQTKIEKINGDLESKRQSTRYSAHGLHEYKGKFNPQVVRTLINRFSFLEGDNIIDPFSGSGTTMLESAFQNINCIGLDINPLAVYIANAKQTAVNRNYQDIKVMGDYVINDFEENYQLELMLENILSDDSERMDYLKKWFPLETLSEIEYLKDIIEKSCGDLQSIFLVLLSNNIRDYSLQEPADLRVRRRKSPFPIKSLIDEFKKSIVVLVEKLEHSNEIIGTIANKNKAFLGDSRFVKSEYTITENYFDGGITSPPYATALPYIDTQRLSLVWLNLISPTEIRPLEGDLIGSREFKKSVKDDWERRLLENSSNIPIKQYNFCVTLLNSLGENDGFRRQAVPSLLYRYLSDMQEMFKNLLPYFKEDAPFALIVGHNHTVLNGKRFDIDTPDLLVDLAKNAGWQHLKSEDLQVYKRFGLHQKNAVAHESLIILYK